MVPLYFVLIRLASKHTTVKEEGLELNEIWRFQSKWQGNFPFYFFERAKRVDVNGPAK